MANMSFLAYTAAVCSAYREETIQVYISVSRLTRKPPLVVLIQPYCGTRQVAPTRGALPAAGGRAHLSNTPSGVPLPAHGGSAHLSSDVLLPVAFSFFVASFFGGDFFMGAGAGGSFGGVVELRVERGMREWMV